MNTDTEYTTLPIVFVSDTKPLEGEISLDGLEELQNGKEE